MGEVRPRERKAQIVSAAAALFHRDGYDRVGMVDIAATVGVTGRAIYRHFSGKVELLEAVVLDRVGRLEAAVDAAAGGSVAAHVDSLADLMLDVRDLGVIVRRESRHLGPEARAGVDARMDVVVGRLADVLGVERGDADEGVRAALAVLASPSWHGMALPRATAHAWLAAMAMSVLERPLPSGPEGFPDAAPPSFAARASRRETILGAAIELFSTRGYAAVRMEDVGAAVGIAGPSVYEHFSGKADILTAALTRGAEWLELGMTRALGAAVDDDEALVLVLRSYVEFMHSHPDLMTLLLTEMIHLPEHQRHLLRRVQVAYIEEWVQLLLATRPDLSPAEARFMVHGVVALINDRLQDRARRSSRGLVSLGLLVFGGSAVMSAA